MKKLFTILALVSFMAIFSACEEEEIVPQETLDTTGTNGSEQVPENQWD